MKNPIRKQHKIPRVTRFYIYNFKEMKTKDNIQ